MFSEKVTCPKCNGNKVVRMRMLPSGESITIPCHVCGATGEIVKPEKAQTRLDIIVKLLHQLELVLGSELPVLDLAQTQTASQYATSGAMGSRFFLVCNQDEMSKIITSELAKFREKQKKNGL